MSTASSPSNQSTYYEPHHSSTGSIASAVALSMVILLAIVGNVLIIVIFRVFKRVRKQVTNHFLVNLAITDLIVALVTMPFWLLWEINRWRSLPPDMFLRKLWTFVDITCEASSIANLAVVSMDRLYSVSDPFKHHTTVTPSLAHKIIFGSWGYALAVASISFVETHWQALFLTILGFAIPLSIMIVCYTKMVFVVRALRKRWVADPNGKKQLYGCIANEYKTAKSLSVVMVAFVICWAPFFVSSLLYHYCESCIPYLRKHPVLPTVTKWLHYLNSALNPVLYTFFNPSYRVVLRRFYAWCMCKDNYRCTSYEAWYLGSRRVSMNSQRSGSLTRANGFRSSSTSVNRPSCACVTSARFERAEIVEEEEGNDDVFTNEEAVTRDEQSETQDKFKPLKNSTSKNRVSFCDTIL